MPQRGAFVALLAAAALPAQAQAQAQAHAQDSGALVAGQEESLRAVIGTRRCSPAGGGEAEIVVCGRGQSPYRLPLPVEPLPGERVRGEVASPVALTKEETCTNIGQTRGCPSFDILAIGLMIGKIVVEQAVKEAIEDD